MVGPTESGTTALAAHWQRRAKHQGLGRAQIRYQKTTITLGASPPPPAAAAPFKAHACGLAFQQPIAKRQDPGRSRCPAPVAPCLSKAKHGTAIIARSRRQSLCALPSCPCSRRPRAQTPSSSTPAPTASTASCTRWQGASAPSLDLYPRQPCAALFSPPAPPPRRGQRAGRLPGALPRAWTTTLELPQLALQGGHAALHLAQGLRAGGQTD